MTPMIFYKDFRNCLKTLVIFPVSLASFAAVYYLFLRQLMLQPGVTVTEGWFYASSLSAAFGLDGMIAIMIGMGVIAAEEAQGTDQFLARLPISMRRLLAEKISAGIVFLLLLYAFTVAYYYIAGGPGLGLGNDNPDLDVGTFSGNLFLTVFSCYFFAVVISKYIKQSLAIFLSTISAEILFWALLLLLFTDRFTDLSAVYLSVLYMLAIFALPGLVVWKQWQLRLDPSVWGSAKSPTLFKGLVWKNFTGEGLLNAYAALLLLATLIYIVAGPDISELQTRSEIYNAQNSLSIILLSGLALLLPAAIGANAYASNEGDGLKCVLYAQPASRQQLYLSKLVAALPVILVGWISLVLTLGDRFPTISLGLFTFFVYVTALHMSLWMRTPMMVILAAISWAVLVFSFISGWMVPRDYPWYFKGFAPLHDPYLVGLIPLSLLTVGGLVTGWRMAADRRFLCGSKTFRYKYNAVGTAACLVVATILVSLIRRLFAL